MRRMVASTTGCIPCALPHWPCRARRLRRRRRCEQAWKHGWRSDLACARRSLSRGAGNPWQVGAQSFGGGRGPGGRMKGAPCHAHSLSVVSSSGGVLRRVSLPEQGAERHSEQRIERQCAEIQCARMQQVPSGREQRACAADSTTPRPAPWPWPNTPASASRHGGRRASPAGPPASRPRSRHRR